MKLAALTLAAFAVLSAPAMAKVPLEDNQHITDSLMAGRVADVIRSTCPSISARMVTAYSKLEDLKKYAVDQGYTEAEVKAFLKDKSQKDRIKALAADYLAKAGAVEGDVESYCVAGRAEIDKGTLAGSMLRSWK
ncbi:MAG: DUF5333 domain-containing protein [Rhodobacteraceae bacterium]|nr:DUF5333 domain-containing protein [Paracoccaceae bacterium]